jgi:ABC-type transport system involved in cytochrome bd biosynthesis fused ATPase/permease subunit
VHPSRGVGAITDALQGLDWHVWLLIAAVVFILIQNVFFSDAKKAKRKKLRDAREQYTKKVLAIRAGKGGE